eukprot:2366277-Pleurochrysis_carterae.AAC.1
MLASRILRVASLLEMRADLTMARMTARRTMNQTQRIPASKRTTVVNPYRQGTTTTRSRHPLLFTR